MTNHAIADRNGIVSVSLGSRIDEIPSMRFADLHP